MASTGSVEEQTTDWKAVFEATPGVSTRKGIAFGYAPPKEDTDTLVLTTRSGKFVDIRLPKELRDMQPNQKEKLHSHASYWAFSGVCKTTYYDPGDQLHPGFQYAAHTVFQREIDSKGSDMVDEGDFFRLPNGDELEVGIWPETGELYKELWTKLEPLPGRTSILKSPIIVAETVPGAAERGTVIRVGDHLQGVYQTNNASGEPEEVVFCRWIRDVQASATSVNADGVQSMSTSESTRETWNMDQRSTSHGDTHFPVDTLTRRLSTLSMNMVVTSEKHSWKIVEFDQ